MKASVVAALSAFLLPLATLAQATSGLATVIATGTGDTVESAKKDAYRAAVEQVVGSIIDPDTLVESDELIKNKVLTYSAAYVEGAAVIGQPERTADGLVHLKIRARVRKTALEEKVREIKPSVAEVSGEDIYARLVSSSDQHEHGSDMIADLFENIREKLVKVETVSGRNGRDPIDVDPATKELFVNVRVSIDKEAYRLFLKEVSMKLRPMCTGVIRAQKDAGRLANRPIRRMGDSPDSPAAANSRYNHAKRADGVGALLVFPNVNADSVTFLTFNSDTFRRISACSGLGNLTVKVRILDRQGGVLREKTQIVASESRLEGECFPGRSDHWKPVPTVWLAPILQGEFRPAPGNYEAFFFTTQRESALLKVPVGSFTPDEGRRIARVEASLDGGTTDLF